MAEKRIVDIGPLLEDLKNELEDLKGATEVLTVEEAAEDEIEELKKLLVIDPQKMIPAWPYKKPKPGHEGFRLLDGPAPDFHRMTVEEFEALPPHIWMDVKKTLPPLEHPVLTVDAYGDYHTNTEYIDNPEIPFCITYNNGRFWPPIAWSKFDRLK